MSWRVYAQSKGSNGWLHSSSEREVLPWEDVGVFYLILSEKNPQKSECYMNSPKFKNLSILNSLNSIFQAPCRLNKGYLGQNLGHGLPIATSGQPSLMVWSPQSALVNLPVLPQIQSGINY